MSKIVASLFDRFNQAQQAVDALVNEGYDKGQINLIAHNVDSQLSTKDVRQAKEESSKEKARSGGLFHRRHHEVDAKRVDVNREKKHAAIEDVQTSGAGAMAHYHTATIGGIGKVLVTGPIVDQMESPNLGLSSGLFINALQEEGIPEDKANIYAEGIRQGGTFVSVVTANNSAEKAADILNRFGPVDLEKRKGQWQRDFNWQNFDVNAEPYSAEEIETQEAESVPADYRYATSERKHPKD